MSRNRMPRWMRSIAIAGMVLGASAAPVHAQEFVNVTDVSFDKVAHLCGESTASGCVRLTGTITCESTGLADLVEVFLRQRDLQGADNLDLLDFACSTEPRAFTAIVEFDGCGFPETRAGCFRPGPALARAFLSDELVAEERVIIRKA
jgi:hypothetical protein